MTNVSGTGFNAVQQQAHAGVEGGKGVNDGSKDMSRGEFIAGAMANGLDFQAAQDTWVQINNGENAESISLSEYQQAEGGTKLAEAVAEQDNESNILKTMTDGGFGDSNEWSDQVKALLGNS